MTFSEALSTFLKIRRIVVAISILAGAGGGYKYGPAVWQKVEDKTSAKTEAKAASTSGSSGSASMDVTTTTNAAGIKLSNCDLGTINLTNHSETCVLLGPGRDCLFTPNVIDSKNLQLTVVVESKKSNGKIHDLSVTQVVTQPGKAFEVAVGDFNFSLTPNITSE